jgi:hypothetical protein
VAPQQLTVALWREDALHIETVTHQAPPQNGACKIQVKSSGGQEDCGTRYPVFTWFSADPAPFGRPTNQEYADFDSEDKDVVPSGFEASAAGLAQIRNSSPWTRFQKSNGADSRVEIHRTAGFCERTTGGCGIVE